MRAAAASSLLNACHAPENRQQTGTELGRWHEWPPARGAHCAWALGLQRRACPCPGGRVPSLPQRHFCRRLCDLPPMSWAASVYCTDHTDPPGDLGWHWGSARSAAGLAGAVTSAQSQHEGESHCLGPNLPGKVLTLARFFSPVTRSEMCSLDMHSGGSRQTL